MRWLVTGGLGFIGVNVVRQLLRRSPGDSFLVVDNLSASSLSVDNARSIWGNTGDVVVHCCDATEYCSATHEEFDYIVHLASAVGPVGVLRFAGEISPTMAAMTQAITRLAWRSKSRLLYVSSSEVYGGGRHGECSAADNCIIPANYSPRLEYAVSKLASEIQISNHCKRGLDAVIVRPFNITGPFQSAKGGFVLPRFLGQAAANKPLTVYGSGTQIRAFTHIDDFVHALLLAAKLGVSGTIYNAGNPFNTITIGDLAKLVIAELDSSSEITFVDPKQLHGECFEESPDKRPAETSFLGFSWKTGQTLQTIVRDSVTAAREHELQSLLWE